MQRGDLEHGIALKVAKTDIARRIRPVCLDFEEADFNALVERMAEIDVRYRLRDDWISYRKLANEVSSTARKN
jgi:IS1 family transposase